MAFRIRAIELHNDHLADHFASSRFVSLRAFTYPAFRRLWAGAFVSTVGTFVQSISIGVYATETTGQAAWTGIMAGLAYLPSVVLSVPGGAIADQTDRRRFVTVLLLAQALVAVVLALLSFWGPLPLTWVGLLVFVSGSAYALCSPAFNALLSEVVSAEDLLSAVSLFSAQFNLARIVGPMCAALVYTASGLKGAFVINALSYLGVLAGLLSMQVPRRRPSPTHQSLLHGITEGLSVAKHDPGIRLALALTMAIGTLVAPFVGLMPAYAIKAFGRGAAGASLLAVAQGVGALVAAVSANAVAQKLGVRRLLNRAIVALAPIAIGYWLSPSYDVAFVLLLALGATYVWSLNALSTTCMTRVDIDMQARINSLYATMLSGGYAVGLFIQGWLADHFGLRLVPSVAAALLFVLVAILHQRNAFTAVDAPTLSPHALAMRKSA